MLYGKGNLGKLAEEYLTAVYHPAAETIDKDSSISRFMDICMVAVAVVNYPYVPIETALFDKGYKTVLPFYDLTELSHFKKWHPLNNGWYAGPLSPNTNTVSSRWADDTSRAHHLQFIAWHKIREEWVFEDSPVTIDDRYFIPEVKLTDHEVFLDGGSCHGETYRNFLSKVKDFREIVCVDGDYQNTVGLFNDGSHFKEVSFLHTVLAEACGVVPFVSGLGYSSSIWHLSPNLTNSVTIDSLEKPFSFIKLHLEGYELPALEGAKHTITAFRPIIAATVYHNEDGVWRTPLWLMENLRNYNFHFRLHGWCGTGAVVYAIPKERA